MALRAVSSFRRMAVRAAMVEDVAHRGSSSGNGSVPAHKTGGAVHRGKGDESGDLLPVDGATFSPFSKTRAGGDVANAGNGLQKRLTGAPDRRALNGLANVAVDLI